jgi:hypothetical protein
MKIEPGRSGGKSLTKRKTRKKKGEGNAVGKLSRDERREMVDMWCLKHDVQTQPFEPGPIEYVSAKSTQFVSAKKALLGGRILASMSKFGPTESAK